MAECSDWIDQVGHRADPVDTLMLTVCLQPSPGGGSGSFLGRASDGGTYFVKPLNQDQGGRVLATEYVVAQLGG